MSGYMWAETAEKALFVVLVIDGKGFVPGREDAINLDEIVLLEPVAWPMHCAPQNPNLAPRNCGVRAAAAAPACAIIPFAANG